jgi:Holliday junction resolvase RusA-like endonuclease
MAKKAKAPKQDLEIKEGYIPVLYFRIEYREKAKTVNNAYYRSKHTGAGYKGMFMKTEYKTYKQRLIDLARQLVGRDFVPLEGPIKMVTYWTFGTRHRKDIQNCGKLEFDAFNKVLYADDSQIIEDHRFKLYRKDDPGVVFEIYGYKKAE